MSDIVRKGDFLVFVDAFEQVSEFFISSINIDLDNCFVGSTGRKKYTVVLGFTFIMVIIMNQVPIIG